MPKLNPATSALMQILLNQHADLLAKLNTTTDPQFAQALIAEGNEILHRINITQNLLFIAASEDLKTSVAAVKSAQTKLKTQLAKIDSVAKFLDKIAGFLGKVDKAIDLAKKVALL